MFFSIRFSLSNEDWPIVLHYIRSLDNIQLVVSDTNTENFVDFVTSFFKHSPNVCRILSYGISCCFKRFYKKPTITRF